jgi:hypothetical protein
LLNTVDTLELTTAVETQFESVDVAKVIDALDCGVVVDGLVLRNPQGQGVLQPQIKLVPPLSCEEFRLGMREHAYKKNGVF